MGTFLKHLTMFDSDTYRVVAALVDKDSVGKGLVVDLNAKCPLSAVQCVLLNKVQVVYTSDLHVEKKAH